ncbi:hypothetical protein ACFL0M_12540 [Thermodesulfobacteriota bacterium]
MADYPYKAKIEEAVGAFSNKFQIPITGAREYLLQNRCKADFCFQIHPKGMLFIEDDDGARAVNNLIKYWIWTERNPGSRPIHLIHIVETSLPAQIENLKFLAKKIKKAVPDFRFHLITLANWQVPDEAWMPKFRETVEKIAEEKI